jgi:Trypsin-co-occurring domain 2
MIGLADVIGELRGELRRAIAAGADEDLRFDLGTIELDGRRLSRWWPSSTPPRRALCATPY